MGGFCDYVCSGRGHYQQVRLVRQGHMLHMALKIPVEGVHHGPVMGQGLEGMWADKLSGVFCQHHLHVIAPLGEL